jgi:hypothetical protein
MAIEPRRGCGYRKVGGLYLVGGLLAAPCDRLPFPLCQCPACGADVKPARGWTWIRPAGLMGAHQSPCTCHRGGGVLTCPVCDPLYVAERAGLLWVGGRFYDAAAFIAEARERGVSRRIAHVPRGFVLGGTWVYLAHRNAVIPQDCSQVREWWTPGIIAAFLPLRLEQLLWQSEATPERVAELSAHGITAVPVPDGDKDHMGTVYDDPTLARSIP